MTTFRLRTLQGAMTAMALALSAAAPVGIGSAHAQSASQPTVQDVAQQRTQVPGYYRFALGDMEVTALYDGYIDLATSLLSGIKAKDLDSLLARMFVPQGNGVQTAVNGFLVHTGQGLVLVDTGTAKAFGPSLGFIPENLRAAGYDPAQVGSVLLTHLHPDHANGLLTADGKAAYPNAVVRVSKADADYWLSEDVAAKAPEQARPMFALARAAVAPYVAAGRFQTFQPGEQITPEITSVPASGHTPGHTGYLFTSKGQSLLMWGDIVHSHSVQFSRPEVAIEFDSDKAQAIATRKRLLADTAARKLWVAGAHLPFPGIGHVRTEGKGYAWVPLEFSPFSR